MKCYGENFRNSLCSKANGFIVTLQLNVISATYIIKPFGHHVGVGLNYYSHTNITGHSTLS